MTCQEFLRLLDEEGGALTAAAREHVTTCPSCGRAWERWRAAQQELRAMTGKPAPEFLTARVMAHVRAEVRERALPAWSRTRLLSALAVAVVVSLGGFTLWQTLRGTGEVREARLETTADRRGDSKAAAPVADRAAPGGAALASKAAPVPQKTSPKPALSRVKAEHAEPRAARPAERRYAPEPTTSPAIESGADREQAGAAAGAVGGVLAAAPEAKAPPAMTGQAAAWSADRPVAESGALAKRDAMRQAQPSPVVLVHLTRNGGAAALTLRLDAAAAPPPGVHWLVQVARDGGIALRDASGDDIGTLHADTVARLRAERLEAGEYRLAR